MSDLVKIYQSGNITEFLLAKDLLEQAEIEVLAKNFEERNMFGYGSVGTGYNVLVGQFELHVLDSNAEEARRIISEAIPDVSLNDDHLPDELSHERLMRRFWLQIFVVIALTINFFGFFLMIPFGYLIFSVLLCVAIALWLKGRELRKDLNVLGYEWVQTLEAILLICRLGGDVTKIPPAAELETIPGFRRTPTSLVEHFNRYRRHQPDNIDE